MAVDAKITVETYSVALSQSYSGCTDAYASILCRGQGYQLYLYFVPSDKLSKHKNRYNPGTKTGSCFLPCEQYAWYIDLLRNEKPVRVNLMSDKPMHMQLFTGPEEAGSGDEP